MRSCSPCMCVQIFIIDASNVKSPRHVELRVARERTRSPITCSTRARLRERERSKRPVNRLQTQRSVRTAIHILMLKFLPKLKAGLAAAAADDGSDAAPEPLFA